ncbi:uncharacterized protein EDB91DRAFT_1351533 [Suillus paluster]|uniref:uncharacterized protein n=1 Tax=Suillus paluster TaxID=48578 RepID=UPI001B887086|nr:uncharacterized protein EDB91DRAFT_1351533 [Suillus paluster]KAG1721197.1 hypothetical protein EDB91DRAFT_1351533 [Suillus paluster]
MPMQVFHDAYFEGKIDLNQVLTALGTSWRNATIGWSWTPELFEYVFMNFLPEIIITPSPKTKNRSMTVEQSSNIFIALLSQTRQRLTKLSFPHGHDGFLDPRMIYTSVIIANANKASKTSRTTNSASSTGVSSPSPLRILLNTHPHSSLKYTDTTPRSAHMVRSPNSRTSDC